MLNWTLIGNSATYDTTRFDLLVLLEGKTNLPYVDVVGVPTIGIGYNLRVNLEPVVRAMVGAGNFSQTLLDRLQTQIDKSYAGGANSTLQANLNQVMANWHNNRDADVPTQFRLSTDNQIKQVMVAIAPNYDGMIDNWLANIPDSDERAALFSMTWNAPSLLGPKLKAAIDGGNRAEAWYEIRYNSNGSAIDGIANRRYVEAEVFGLYDDEAQVGWTEAAKIGRMLANHHVNILSYEQNHDAESAGALKGMPEIDAIQGEMAPAIRSALAHFGLSTAIGIEELLVANAGLANISGDKTGHDGASNDRDMLIGHQGANLLNGGAAGDIIVGLGGADRLFGGRGADVFVFSAVADSRAGSGQDRIGDFTANSDVIDLSEIDANGTEQGDTFTFLATAGQRFGDHAGELRYRHAGSDTIVEADTNGDGQADLRILISGLKDLTAGDFVL